MSDTLQRILAGIDDERLEALLVDSVEQYSPSYAEEPAMAIFADALNEAGIAYIRQPIPDRQHGDQYGNLIVEMGPAPHAMVWVGHVDTVPVIGEEEPHTRIEGDILYGLGSADMKSGCAAIVEALRAVRESGVTLKRGLSVALVVGEEEYGDGSAAFLERSDAPLTVIGEPTGLVPCIDHYGYQEYRLRCRGARVHAALPELGASAIHAMLRWLTLLFEEVVTPEHVDTLAVNPREVRGGGDMFVVADECEALVDVHVAPGVDGLAATRLIEQARDKAATSHPDCSFDFERVYVAEAYALASEDRRLAPLVEAYRGIGMEWMPGAFRSHSDGNMFFAKGGAPVICGPGKLEVAHTRNEHVSLAETRQAARLYAAMIHEACIA